MRIRNADELIWYLRKRETNVLEDLVGGYDKIYLNKALYDLLVTEDWKCPLRDKLKSAMSNGLVVVRD